MIKLDLKGIYAFYSQDEYEEIVREVSGYLDNLLERKGAGREYLGWLDLPDIALTELEAIKRVAEEVRERNALLVCIGIGGSYLGARAVISAIKPGTDRVFYAGKSLCSADLALLLQRLEKENEIYLNVISKSGTTTEPGIAFRILRDFMKRKYGRSIQDRIVVTTDREKGALRRLADMEGYRSFVIHDDVGGRFSVLTPVGLFPIACAGIDIERLLKGAAEEKKSALSTNYEQNNSLRYAAARYLAYQYGKAIEVLASFDTRLFYLQEWWKQLFGESEGKEGKSLFPAAVQFTTDLHSLGQWIQEGVRNILETFLIVEKAAEKITIPHDAENLDNLNYLSGRELGYVNQKAWEGTQEAHTSGGVPNLAIILREITPESLGGLIFFFETAVALSAYTLRVNPFNQPGVEQYKKNMFRLLGKPGYK